MRVALVTLSAVVLLWCSASAVAPRTMTLDARMPSYAHVFVIIAENKDYDQVVGSGNAPRLSALAQEYGNATQFYAETHPSEPNYVAMVGGYTYGISDDDAFYCVPHERNPECPHSGERGYVDHTIDAPSLADQLNAAHRTWKEYLESIPSPGSLAVTAGEYASKHSGFVNFRAVQRDPQRAEHLVGFDRLDADLRENALPNFALIVPNICNEMHGERGPGTPEGCDQRAFGALVRRGDDNIGAIVQRIMASDAWRSRENSAIVITFDENDDYSFEGCCGNDPNDPANRGGGRIPTIVVTNHGPRHRVDATPYNHYSLLRTIEDVFGIHTFLRRAAAAGVRPMYPLFQTAPGR